MLTELIELSQEMKATQSEMKQNIQGTNSEWKETGTQISSLDQKGKQRKTFNQNKMKKQEFKKNEERPRKLRDNFKYSNIQIIGVPEGEEEEQEIENSLEKIMKKNFPNLVKEIDFQEVQEAQSPQEAGPKEEHTKAHHN